jgi:hypothetical protein
MAFNPVNVIGPNFTQVDTAAQHRVGTRCKGMDPTFGDGEFIYLKGVASTVAGDNVVYDENYATTRAVSASRGPVAVAMAATVANTWGWYQIQGVAAVNALAAMAADALCFLTATAGSIDDAVVAAQKVDGMRSQSALGTPAAAQVYAELAYPCANGNG